jgi:hypothetical protein
MRNGGPWSLEECSGCQTIRTESLKTPWDLVGSCHICHCRAASPAPGPGQEQVPSLRPPLPAAGTEDHSGCQVPGLLVKAQGDGPPA